MPNDAEKDKVHRTKWQGKFQQHKLNQCNDEDKDGTNICMIEAKLPMPSLNSPPKFESFSTLPKKEKKSIIKYTNHVRNTSKKKKKEILHSSYIGIDTEYTMP